MIAIFAALISVLTFGLTLVQSVLVINYRRFLRSRKPNTAAHDEASIAEAIETDSPHAAIVLCLRGDEAGLIECLTGIIGQDYSGYEIHIVFDSQEDSAVETVTDFFAEREQLVRLHFFEPQSTCSYKCSAICHVVRQLDASVEVVAFCDADAIVDQDWLSDLAAGLKDPSVGATTGNRWFSPLNPSSGSLLRKYWNSAAVVQMQAYNIAWGGSLAIRRSIIEECNLLGRWSKSFCEDTLLTDALGQKGYQLKRLPHLVVENHESTSIRESIDWIARQLITVRLHHPGWFMVVGHGVLSAVATWLAPIAAILLSLVGHFEAAGAVGAAFAVYQVVNLLLLWIIESNNRDVIRERDAFNTIEPASHVAAGPHGHLKAIALTQLLYPVALLKAIRATHVPWRGVNYAIGPNSVRVQSVDKVYHKSTVTTAVERPLHRGQQDELEAREDEARFLE